MEQSEFLRRLRENHKLLERQTLGYARIGWHAMREEKEVLALHDRFYGTLIRDGGVRVPAPYMTWDVTGAVQLPEDSRASLIDDLHRRCLPALKRCGFNSEPWYAHENINHECYRVHFDEIPDHLDAWPIELLPWHDPCYLHSPDLRYGIIAQFRESITIFGDQLLMEIRNNLPLVLNHIIEAEVPEL